MLAMICSCYKKINSQDGRVGLRRQFQVLVRKGMGSNPILDMIFFTDKDWIGIMHNIFKM